MRESSLKSFVRSLTLFALFICVSCGLTIVVSSYTKAEKAKQSAAAAKALMLGETR